MTPRTLLRLSSGTLCVFFWKTVPAAAIDVVEIDGKNMRAQMIEDRTALLASGRTRADPAYFGAMKKKYMGELMGTSAVVVADESSDLPDALTDALKHARTTQRRDRKREPLVHYLWQCRSALSQAAVIELVDLLVETQQHNCLKQAILVQEVFGTFARLDMLRMFAKEIAPAKHILEHSLITIYNAESKGQTDYGFDTFWVKYNKTARLFLHVPFVARVLAETEDFCNCIPEISALATGSVLGTELFMSYCPEVVDGHVDKFMREVYAEITTSEVIDSTLVNGLVAKMLTEADRLKVDRLLTSRVCNFDFMGDVCSFKMTTAFEQARHHIAATIKTVAVTHGLLSQMSVEAAVDPKVVDVKIKKPVISPELLHPFQFIRTLMDKEAQAVALPTAASWSHFFESKRALWFSEDPTFVLEIQHVKNLAGPLGGKLLLRQAIDLLPCNAKIDWTYAVVATNLRKLEISRAWAFATPAARGIVSSTLEILVAMERGEGPPKSKFPPGTHMQQVGMRLSLFCTYFPPGSSSSAAVRVVGAAAAAMHLQNLEKMVKEMTLSDLSPVTNLEVFRWVLSGPDAEKLSKLGEAAYEMVLKRATNTTGLADAMDMMVAAATSAKAAKDSKKSAASVVKASPAHAKKKHKKA